MDERVWTLAVWDVAERRWAALATSRDEARIRKLHWQLVNLVMVFAEVVEVARDDDDAVVAALAMLLKVHPGAVFQSYFDLASLVSLDRVPADGPALN